MASNQRRTFSRNTLDNPKGASITTSRLTLADLEGCKDRDALACMRQPRAPPLNGRFAKRVRCRGTRSFERGSSEG